MSKHENSNQTGSLTEKSSNSNTLYEQRKRCFTLISSTGNRVLGELRVNLNPDRIGVLIGEKGAVKRRIEKATKTTITVDSQTGEVVIKPAEGATLEDVYKAKRVIEAIGYGFNPEVAMTLLEEDKYLDVIDLKEVARSREDMVRIKGRLIGEKGKFRKTLEEMTGAYVSIYDRYVAIIGDFEQHRVARTAIEMIIEGRPHRSVINFLKREVAAMKRRAWFTPY